jgi:hypothetical protein
VNQKKKKGLKEKENYIGKKIIKKMKISKISKKNN